MLSILLHHIRFLNNNHFCVVNEHENRGSSQSIRYINFVIDTSAWTYFKDNLVLIKGIVWFWSIQSYAVNEYENRGSPHCIRYINLAIDTSFRTYFKDNLMLIKDWIGTIPLKLLVSFLWEGDIINMGKTRVFIDFILPPLL